MPGPRSPVPYLEGEDAKNLASIAADLLPVVGEAKSAAEAAMALYQGNYDEAALSAIGIVPVIGPKAKVAAKMAKYTKARKSADADALGHSDLMPVQLYKNADTKKMARDFDNDNLPPGLVKGMEESGFDMSEYGARDSMRELIDIVKNRPEELADKEQFAPSVLYHVGRTYGVK